MVLAALPTYGPIGMVRGWLLARPRLLTGWEPLPPNSWLPYRHAPYAIQNECEEAFDTLRDL